MWKWKLFYVKTIFFLILFAISVHADECDKWFKKLNLKTDTCVTSCSLANVDMTTYMCTLECDKLCKQFADENSNFYGLTQAELGLCSNNKIKCLNAYKLSWAAEKLCLRIYSQSRTNDESDACRHYIWAILVSKEEGVDFAQKVLEAHEINPKEAKEETEMDTFNNKIAIDDFKKIEKSKNITDEEVIQNFKNNIRNKKFKIMKPRYEKTGGLP